MQVEIGPAEDFEPQEALFRRSVSQIQQSTKESAPTKLIDDKKETFDEEDVEPEPEPKPLIPAQVPILAAKESRTSMDDVRLVAIPSPRVTGKSNQSHQVVPERSDSHVQVLDSMSVTTTLKMRSWSQEFEANRLVKFEEVKLGTVKHQRKTSKSKKPKKSILKRTASPSTRIRVKNIQEEIVKAIKDLSQGSIMVKYSTKGVPSKRIFKVSPDGTELWWRKSRGFTTKFELATVKLVIVGPRTQPFSKYDWKSGRPWNCFSLVADHRSVDIECLSRDQFMMWYFGLLQLVPLNFNNLDKPQVLWRLGLYKTVQISLQCKIPVHDVWHRLVKQAREELHGHKGDQNAEQSPSKQDQPQLTSPRSQKFIEALDTTANST